jgi:hypothetical protein
MTDAAAQSLADARGVIRHRSLSAAVRIMKCSVVFFVLALSIAPIQAQQFEPDSVLRPEPPLRRWLDIQTFSVDTRYRFTADSQEVLAANQLQYRESFRAQFNLDPGQRYTVSVGYFTGNSFGSAWDNWGVGNNTAFDRTNNYIKQLYASAMPVRGLTLQYGGLYLTRGESDELITYDSDGYLVGERVTVRRPKELFVDEISVTRGAIGPRDTPSLMRRWGLLKEPNYTQVLGVKRFSRRVAGSVAYDRQIGSNILRGAVTLRFDPSALVSAVRYEQYRRVTPNPSAGFGLWAEGPVTEHLRVQGGYVSVDQHYGGWNADRIQSGRHFFLNATLPIHGPLSASIYATHALSAPYQVSIGRRFDAVISYDVLSELRRTGIF